MSIQGVLVQVTTETIPLLLVFSLNPTNITYTRNIGIKTGDKGKGKNSQKVSGLGSDHNNMTFSMTIMLDATDQEGALQALGVEPQIAVLEQMTTIRSPDSPLSKLLKPLGIGGGNAISTSKPPLLAFIWGPRVLPVYITQCTIQTKEHFPTLIPYRAEATLSLEVDESHDLYAVEEARQMILAKTQLLLNPLPF